MSINPKQTILTGSTHFDHAENQQNEAKFLQKLWVLESLDQINRAIQAANDLEQMMHGVLDALLATFQCDRVWLLHPCDPDAAMWQTVKERARPGHAGPWPAQQDAPMNPHHAHLFQTLRQADAPVQFSPDAVHKPSPAMMSHFQMQSALAAAIFPKADQPYALGLQQCAGPRRWTQPEAALLHEASRRLAVAIAHLQEVCNLRESEHRLDEIQRIAHVAYWGRELDTNTNVLSDEVYRIFGLPLDKQYDKLDEWQAKWAQMIHPEDRRLVTQAKESAQHDGSRYDMEYRIVRPDGEVRVVHGQGMVIHDESGRPRRMAGIVQDITKLRQAQEELRASESRFRTVVEHAADAVFLYGPGGVTLDVNQQACENLGYSRDELLRLRPSDFDVEITADGLLQLEAQLNAGKIVTFETHHRRKDGSLFPVEVRTRAVGPEDPGVAVALVRDISERKHVEAVLKESEERYRTLFEDSPSMYFTVEADGAVSSVNRFGAEQLGYTVTELLGRSVLEVFHAEDKAKALDAIRKCIAHPGELFHWSLRKICKDGSLMWVEETARATQRADGSALVFIVCEDISERKRTEQALIENNNLLNAIIEGTTDAVFVKDMQGRYMMINSAGANFLGKRAEEVIGKNDQALFSPDTAPNIMVNDQKVIATEKPQVFEITATSAGVERTYHSTKGVLRDAQGKMYGIVGISRDITELKHLEEQFRQSQKMEAVGRLAGGVAHDFNNLLTVINGYSKLMLRTIQTDERNYKRLTEIQKAGERAADLTRQLLAFSRRQILQPQMVNLNTLVSELLKLLQPLIGEDIELSLALGNDLGLVKIDPGQFEQSIINLAVNARDAMPHGGRLTIATQRVNLGNDHAEQFPEIKAGRYIQVTVSDSGHGMDDETKARIFEPFFTTKEPGKGTGLGLAMVYGFVKQSDGHIEVNTEVGRGTTFRIYLPHVGETKPTGESLLESAQIPQGAETILLVEDEDAVRDLVKQVLEAGGYTVLEARDGQAAVLVAQQYEKHIHLLVTDLVMPRMNGRQLADYLAQSRPTLRFLFMSGYTDEAVSRQGVSQAGVAFVQKPFDPLYLAQKVREVLNAPQS